jgi:hypothetical protein
LARRRARTIRAIIVAPLNARAVLIVGHEVKLSVGCIPQLSRGGALGILDQIQYLEYKQQDMRNNSQEVVPHMYLILDHRDSGDLVALVARCSEEKCVPLIRVGGGFLYTHEQSPNKHCRARSWSVPGPSTSDPALCRLHHHHTICQLYRVLVTYHTVHERG